MKFDISTLPRESLDHSPKIGDVYPAQGNRPTVAWVIVGISKKGEGNTAYMLGIDSDGDICSTVSYNFIALHDRPKIGRVKNIDDLQLVIDAFPVSGLGRRFNES